jgi:hypothetical protein
MPDIPDPELEQYHAQVDWSTMPRSWFTAEYEFEVPDEVLQELLERDTND